MLEKEGLIKYANDACNWIKEYVEKTHAKGVVIGNSGGKDSATVIAMATKALGKDKVYTVAMPCNSISKDLSDAKLVADKFGVQMLTIDLTSSYKEMEDIININLKNNDFTYLNDESKINMKPRFRMTCLYSIAQTLGCLVCGTGNLCEQMVGYTTKWGDSASDFNPIANFTVDEVLFIGKYLGVPDEILNKAPSDGLGGKTDEEKMGIKYSEIAEMIENGNTQNLDSKNEIIRRYKASAHKRNLVPKFYFDRKNYLNDI